MTFVVVLIFTIIPEVTNLKKSKMLYNWPKLLVVTQIVRFGSHYLEIRSDVSSFSDPSHGKKHYFASVITVVPRYFLQMIWRNGLVWPAQDMV